MPPLAPPAPLRTPESQIPARSHVSIPLGAGLAIRASRDGQCTSALGLGGLGPLPYAYASGVWGCSPRPLCALCQGLWSGPAFVREPLWFQYQFYY